MGTPMYPMTNLVAEARKKYLFAMVAAAALVAAILVYLHFQGRWGYLVAITALDTKRPILIAFAAREVVLHRTRAERVQEIRGNGTGRWIYPPCSPEFFKKFEMEEVEIEVKPGEDISLWGLGWVAVRRGGRILISKPKFMGWCVRPSLSTPWR